MTDPLYIPLNFWFNSNPTLAIPLIALPKELWCELPTENENYLYDIRYLYTHDIDDFERLETLCGYDLLLVYNQSLPRCNQRINITSEFKPM